MQILVKASLIWLVMVLLAVINGGIREKILAPHWGTSVALPLSGLSLAVLIFTLTYVSLPWFGPLPESSYLLIGAGWVSATVGFEYLLGHFVMGKTWAEINESFNLSGGNLFIMVLLVSAAAPWCAARLLALI